MTEFTELTEFTEFTEFTELMCEPIEMESLDINLNLNLNQDQSQDKSDIYYSLLDEYYSSIQNEENTNSSTLNEKITKPELSFNINKRTVWKNFKENLMEFSKEELFLIIKNNLLQFVKEDIDGSPGYFCSNFSLPSVAVYSLKT